MHPSCAHLHARSHHATCTPPCGGSSRVSVQQRSHPPTAEISALSGSPASSNTAMTTSIGMSQRSILSRMVVLYHWLIIAGGERAPQAAPKSKELLSGGAPAVASRGLLFEFRAQWPNTNVFLRLSH